MIPTLWGTSRGNMDAIVVCDSCQRCDVWMKASRTHSEWFRCGMNGGAAVNAAGCTGACLYWCVHNISNPGWFPEDGILDDWSILETVLECMERICENINEVGYALLCSVPCLPSIANDIPMTLEDWIFIAWDRWEYMFTRVPTAMLDDMYPNARRFYSFLTRLHSL